MEEAAPDDSSQHMTAKELVETLQKHSAAQMEKVCMHNAKEKEKDREHNAKEKEKDREHHKTMTVKLCNHHEMQLDKHFEHSAMQMDKHIEHSATQMDKQREHERQLVSALANGAIAASNGTSVSSGTGPAVSGISAPPFGSPTNVNRNAGGGLGAVQPHFIPCSPSPYHQHTTFVPRPDSTPSSATTLFANSQAAVNTGQNFGSSQHTSSQAAYTAPSATFASPGAGGSSGALPYGSTPGGSLFGGTPGGVSTQLADPLSTAQPLFAGSGAQAAHSRETANSMDGMDATDDDADQIMLH